MKFREFKLVADFPYTTLKVGDVVVFDKLFDKREQRGYEKHTWNGKYYTTFDKEYWIPEMLEKYPHLFEEIK
jgi:hypothetical protein